MRKLTDTFLENLWEKLGDVPVTNNEKIDENFYIWKKGTDKYSIWHWFDEKHSLGLAKGLMNFGTLSTKLCKRIRKSI